jgi:hypothetical protein
MTRNGALIVGVMLNLLVVQPVCASQCPAPDQMISMMNCMDTAASPADIERCAGGWNLDLLWNCLGSDPAYKNIRFTAIAPQRVPAPPPAPPQRAASNVCDPHAVMQAIEKVDPGAAPTVKYGALQKWLEMNGCIARTPPPQTTTCLPLIGGGFSCTTQ